MSTSLTPYVHFIDGAREALEFYHGIFGGDLSIATFREYGVSEEPGEADKVMHGLLNGKVRLMAADTPAFMAPDEGAAISLALSGEEADEAELRGYFDALAEGGEVTVALDKAPWGAVYGQLTDRYGTKWMVNIGG